MWFFQQFSTKQDYSKSYSNMSVQHSETPEACQSITCQGVVGESRGEVHRVGRGEQGNSGHVGIRGRRSGVFLEMVLVSKVVTEHGGANGTYLQKEGGNGIYPYSIYLSFNKK